MAVVVEDESQRQGHRSSTTENPVILSSSMSESSAQWSREKGGESSSLTSLLLDNLDRSGTGTGTGTLPPDNLCDDPASLPDSFGRESGSSAASAWSTPSFLVTDPDKIRHDPFVTSYYANFHSFHPVALPRAHLIRLHDGPPTAHISQTRLRPVVAVLRLIGYIYDAKEWSVPLQEFLDACLSEADPRDPFTVQARLLYSIALFWYDGKDASKTQMDTAADVAIDLEMFHQPFARDHGHGDAVVTECWRRTWWTAYILYAYYAGSLGTMNYELIDVEPTTELPCEEAQYESGVSKLGRVAP
jgi:hypothetical protein